MIRKASASALMFLWAFLGLLAQQDVAKVHMEKANQMYLNNDFAGARDEYLRIENSGLISFQLFYNLGNTYYKLGQIPSAILYYERALLLNPRDEDTRFNLTLANQMVVDKINPVREFFVKTWIRSAASALKPGTWGILTVVFALLFATIAVFLYATRGGRLRRSGLTLGSLTLFLFFLSLFLGSIENHRVRHGKQAIVFTPTITAKSSPDAGGTELFVIHEGLKVRIMEKMGEWIRIRIPDGNEAWVPESSIVKI